MVLIEIEPCGAETMRVIGMAERYVQKNHITKGQIWCVYDKDSFPAGDFNGVVERAENLNHENPELQYHAAWSNECIEFWFLLHFAYYTSNNHRSEYIKFLNEKYAELGVGKYHKNMAETFDILMNKGNPKLAVKYAKMDNGEPFCYWKKSHKKYLPLDKSDLKMIEEEIRAMSEAQRAEIFDFDNHQLLAEHIMHV